MDKIILEDKYTTHQKITFLLYIGAPIIIIIVLLLKLELNYKGYLLLTFVITIYLFLISIAFSKKGFLKLNSKLYKASFFRGKLFFKKEIDISKTPKLAILKFKKSQKYSWFSDARPDLASDFNSFEINILNDRHTKIEALMDLSNEKIAQKAVDFLVSNFDLKFEVYSPFKKKISLNN